MYKMVIIDDEPAELNFISWVVKDNNLPIHICGKGSNGREALSLVDIHQPDFIIIDISMPILSGLDAAKIIKEKYPQMQLYILTAFQRFSYAQTAIKISVDDYLCKPISPEALVEVLKNGIKQCLRERLKHCRQNRVLCKSNTEDSNMQKVLEILGLGRVSRFRSDLQNLDNVEWMLVGSLLCRQQSGYEYALLQAFIRKVKQFDLLRQAVIVSGCRILIWGKGNSEQVVSLLGNIIEEWYAASHIQFSAEIVCLNKKSFNTLDELSRVVYQADTSQFWEQAGIRIPDTGTMILAPSLDLETFCSQFVDRVFLVGVDTLDTILYKLLDELKMRRSTREGVVQVILDFFSLVTDKIDELGITIEITTLRQQLQKIVWNAIILVSCE